MDWQLLTCGTGNQKSEQFVKVKIVKKEIKWIQEKVLNIEVGKEDQTHCCWRLQRKPNKATEL